MVRLIEQSRASIRLTEVTCMRDLDISPDMHSLSDFKSNTAQFVSQMRESGHPVLLTIDGKPELVVQDVSAYQKLLDQIDDLEALEGIKLGLADVEAGRLTSLEDFEQEFRKTHGLSRRSS